MTGFCNICQTDVVTEELLSHISLYHPDFYEPLETWPDGGVVVLEDLDPSDFQLSPVSDADSALLLAAVQMTRRQRFKTWVRSRFMRDQ